MLRRSDGAVILASILRSVAIPLSRRIRRVVGCNAVHCGILKAASSDNLSRACRTVNLGRSRDCSHLFLISSLNKNFSDMMLDT